MSFTPVIAIHTAAALAAVVIGPLALWSRRSGHVRTRLHRAAGYSWVLLMVFTALSALFIPAARLPNIAGFGPIHLLVPYTLFSITMAFVYLARGNVVGHRKTMQWLYIGSCVIAGAFTLLPNRYLGRLIWGQWLGWA